MVDVLQGEITVIEGETETLLCPGVAATFRAGVQVGGAVGDEGLF